MADIHSTRQFHSELSIVCSSLETIARLIQDDDIETVLHLPIARFRELLDVADAIVGPD